MTRLSVYETEDGIGRRVVSINGGPFGRGTSERLGFRPANRCKPFVEGA